MSPSTSQNSTEEPSWSLIRLVRPTGTRKNSTTANTSATTTRPGPHAPRDLLRAPPRSVARLAAAAARWPRPRARESRSPASRPARPRRARSAGAAGGGGASRSRAGSVCTSISPSAASCGERSPSASCSALGLRTATAQLETPRIITPSSTAWPPTGASRCALSSPSASRATSRPAWNQASSGPTSASPSPLERSAGATGIPGEPAARRADIGYWADRPARSAGDPWQRGAGSARRVRRCPSASGGPCRTGGSSSTPRRAAPRWVARVMNSLPHVQRTCAGT